MRPRQQLSRTAIELVKRFEGYRRKAAQLPDGRWTIGYGHTLSAREGAEVSQSDAEALLVYDLLAVAGKVAEVVYAPLTQNQFDALTAFAFSVGPDAFRASEVLKRVNEGAFIQAAYALELWRRAEFQGETLVIDALVRRRAAEKLLFLTPPQNAWPLAPSAVLKPQLDWLMRDPAPAGAPAVLHPSLHGEIVEIVREPILATSEPLPVPPEPPERAPAADEAPEITAREPEAPEAMPESVGVRLEALFTPPSGAEPPPEEGGLEFAPLAEATLPEATALPDEPSPAPQAAPDTPRREDGMPRILFREFEPEAEGDAFMGAPREPRPREPEPSPPAIVGVLLLGLVFFAGGVFWATHAQGPQTGVFTPLLTGWLAGVAGVGFIASAVFMLLQRLGRAEQRRRRR